MIKCGKWPVGVCSWSLRDNLDQLAEVRRKLNLGYLHLNSTPAMGADGKFLSEIKKQGWRISSMMIGFGHEDYSTLQTIKETGGIVPDARWGDARRKFVDAIELTSSLKVPYLSFHCGFIDLCETSYAQKLFDRVKGLADKAAEKKVILLMETGQETADEMKDFLERMNHPAVGVNFDPANMILYGKGNPIEAVGILGPWIKHVHIKDACKTKTPGTWGKEVPWGGGEVGGFDFLNALKETGFAGVLAIERESRPPRPQDIESAVKLLKEYQG